MKNTKKSKSISILVDAYFVILLAAFGFVLTMIAEITDRAGGGLSTSQHILFSFFLGFGCLLFGLSRRIAKSELSRKLILLFVSVIYIFLMIMVYLGMLPFIQIYWMVILCIGYVGGAIYYYVMAEMLQIAHSCVVMLSGVALPYLLQIVMQDLIAKPWVSMTVYILLFVMIIALLFNPPEFAFGEILPFSDNDKMRKQAISQRLKRLVGTAVLMIVSTGIVEMSWAADSVDLAVFYKWPRTGIVIAIILVGIFADRFAWAGVEKLVMLSLIFVFAAVYGPEYSGVRLFIFNFCAGVYNAYLLLGFWILAPSTGHPDLWASGGRIIAMVETVYFYVVRDVSVSGNYFLILIQAISVALVIVFLHSSLDEIYPKAKDGDALGAFCEKYHFTPRECDVMAAIVSSDETVKVLSAELNISERLFYRYIKQMSEKVGGVDNRNGLVKLYLNSIQREQSTED